jgi:hypothetical protein
MPGTSTPRSCRCQAVARPTIPAPTTTAARGAAARASGVLTVDIRKNDQLAPRPLLPVPYPKKPFPMSWPSPGVPETTDYGNKQPDLTVSIANGNGNGRGFFDSRPLRSCRQSHRSAWIRVGRNTAGAATG